MPYRGTNLRLLLLALLMLCALHCNAARHDASPVFHNDSGYSKSKILRMGLERFLDVYTHHTRRWQLEEEAYAVYAHYKEEDNRKRTGHFPPVKRRQMKRLYVEVDRWEGNALELRYDDYPHGTAIRGLFNSSPAEYEEFIGHVISRLALKDTRFAATHWNAHQTNYLIEHLLGSYQILAGSAEKSVAFRNAFKEARIDTIKVERLLTSLPPAIQEMTALHVTRFIHRME